MKHYLERVRAAGLAVVSENDRNRLLIRHLKPSLQALELFRSGEAILDIGSGGGFPAIPLAIANPTVRWTLVESSARKVAFLQRVSRETGLSNVQVICSRIDELSNEYNSAYDVVTARSVAGIPTLLEWGIRFLKPTGRFVLWKGQNWREEVDPDKGGVKLTLERELADGGKLIVLETLATTLRGGGRK